MVESTTSSAPCRWAISARAGRSATAVVGLATVSAYTILVSGRTAARTWSRSVTSTKSVSHPEPGRHVAQEAVGAPVHRGRRDHVRCPAR